MAISLYTTADNSHTLYNGELDETYHSRNGALEEALHVYIAHGFSAKAAMQKTRTVLEVGFGTGLNAILTVAEAEKTQADCCYVTLETFPLPSGIIAQLNYHSFIPVEHHQAFTKLHEAEWNNKVKISPHFALNKVNESIHNYKPDQLFDVVYFDAFGPDKQPDMWTPDVFEKLYTWMNKDGILVTYSAKGDVRRALQRAGFTTELLPGGAGKRNMLRALKP